MPRGTFIQPKFNYYGQEEYRGDVFPFSVRDT